MRALALRYLACLLCAFAMLLPPMGYAVAQARVVIACGSVGVEAELCREGAEDWARQTGNEVALVSTPGGSTERLALFQQLLAARSADIDVFQIDVVWPGILARHLLDLSDAIGAETLSHHFEAVVQNNTVDGRLVAMPWFTNAGVLYYRRDLLERHGRPVPQSWAELAETAHIIMQAERDAGQARMWGFVFQARAYEGLTVNALEWLHSHGAGTIVAPDGTVTANTPEVVAILARVAGWVGTIAPRGVLNYAEEDARGVFQSGNAVFMRNWPYAWPLLNAPDSPVTGRVGVALLPRGGADGQHSATLGGEQLAVSRYSRSPEAAISLVRHLASRAEQKRRAIRAGLNPTIPTLYADAQVLAANPFFGTLYGAFVNAVARPSAVTGSRYNQVSAEFWNAVHTVLSGRRAPEEALRRLDRILLRVGRDGRW
jgi:trehalose/maltose transport system substrate-binding protein